jgi:thioredoxin 1
MKVTAPCILLSEDNFQSEVLASQRPVLVDCWASWCGSSRRINPWLGELLIEFAGRLQVGRLNVAESEALAAQYGIRAVPTLLLFQHGQIHARVTGSMSKQALVQQINALEIMNALEINTLGLQVRGINALETNVTRLGNTARGIRIACL